MKMLYMLTLGFFSDTFDANVDVDDVDVRYFLKGFSTDKFGTLCDFYLNIIHIIIATITPTLT